MTGRPWRRLLDWANGLAPRVALYLSLALLPLGLIALWQTRGFQEAAERRAELTLLALTSQGATGVRQAIERALGAAEALDVLAELDPDDCAAALGRFAEVTPYSFAALLDPGGRVACASPGAPADLGARLAGIAEGGRLRVVPAPLDDGGLVVLAPLGAGEGLLALALAPSRIAPAAVASPVALPRQLVTFDAEGRVLTAQGVDTSPAPAPGGLVALADLPAVLPVGRDLAAEARRGGSVFEGTDAAGRQQVYSVTPIIPGVAYAMGVWAPAQAGPGFNGRAAPAVLFPLLMWAVGLAVAFWSIHRLVIGRVAELGARMRRFGRDRTLPAPWADRSAPRELRAIDEAFRHTAEAILHDEARMENAFRERGVLLKEVHHRVKNNLQLISSIISMQLRRIPEPRTRAILRRLQDRVLTLAAIYRTLYTSPDMGDVNVAPVLRTIAEGELRSHGLDAAGALDIEDLALDPDKAVPLVFLAAEALSNAVAHLGSRAGRPELALSLRRDGELATLLVCNTLGGDRVGEEAQRGLGQPLIQAFAAQVGGPVVVDATPDRYRLSVTFPLGGADPAHDAPRSARAA